MAGFLFTIPFPTSSGWSDKKCCRSHTTHKIQQQPQHNTRTVLYNHHRKPSLSSSSSCMYQRRLFLQSLTTVPSISFIGFTTISTKPQLSHAITEENEVIDQPTTSNKKEFDTNVLRIETISKPIDAICSKIQSRTNDLLEFRYEARIGNENGRLYDSSDFRGTGQPYAYVLGSGDIVPGVDQGLYNMCIGEVRTISIPPVLGYSSSGVNLYKIPPYTNLFWKIELISINFIKQNDDRTRQDIDDGY